MLLTLSGLLVSTLAWGEEPIPRKDALRNGFYVAPLYSQTFVDEERGTADGTGYALALGYRGSGCKAGMARKHSTSLAWSSKPAWAQATAARAAA